MPPSRFGRRRSRRPARWSLTAVIASLRGTEFDTVLGRIDFDDKGDLTTQSWVWYVWKGGEYVPVE